MAQKVKIYTVVDKKTGKKYRADERTAIIKHRRGTHKIIDEK